MVLKFYYDLISQPSRALYIFLKKVGIPFESCTVDLTTSEQFTKEFKQNLNKFSRVPFIHHDNFKLAESIAIVRYITREFDVAENWYPKDSKRQAEADVYLEWQHMNIRLNCAYYSLHRRIIPTIKNKQPNLERAEYYKSLMVQTLEQFQNNFLNNGKFIGGNEISYADVAAACEIEQPRMAGYEVRDHFPKIKSWIEEVRKECNPFYDEAHVTVVQWEKNAN